MRLPLSLLAPAVLCAWALSSPASAQDAIWEHQQHIQAQQAEQARIMEMGADAACCGDEGGYDESYDENAARFNYYPPEAWDDFVRHGYEVEAQAEAERRAADPDYRALAEGTWTFDNRTLENGTRVCAATFWTLGGGVTLAHWGGTEDVTLLGYFGGAIPNPDDPRTVRLALTQSGETQAVRGINMHFPPVSSMGIALFTVPSAQALVSSIEERQDFRVELDGNVIAQGEWHSGRAAQRELGSCLTQR